MATKKKTAAKKAIVKKTVASKPATKKAVEKTAAKKAAPAKKAVAKKTDEPRKLTPTGRMCELLMERKYTDAEILAQVQSEFPEKTNIKKAYVSIQRSDINAGRKKNFTVPANKPLKCLVEEK